jgi:nitrate/TMAO reductase-like tetraheme cytochrome c subunit
MAQETGKQRASRVPLDYYKKPDLLERWKNRLGAIALVVAVGWLAAGLLGGDQGRLRYSRGPVASVHQTWEANCTACHEPFVPIRGNDHWASGLFTSADREGHRCEACHAGPPHHANQTWTPGCAACHREHRGRDASLVRLPDSDCTQCHADLGRHVTGDLSFVKEVSRFSKEGHPEFRHLFATAAAQKLKFNHKLHMSAGMATPEKGDPNFTLDRIPQPFRARYQAAPSSARVQLDCNSCHQLDGGGANFKASDHGLPSALFPERAAGAYMLPINYEAHCQACHALTFERKDPGDPRSGHLSVAHRLQPQEIHQYLEGLYAGKALKEEWKVFEQFIPTRSLPGKLKGEDRARIVDLIGKKVEIAEKNLYLGNKTCGQCHHFEPEAAVLGEALKPGVPPTFRIAPTRVPQIWFAYALFNHTAHRALDCRSCHDRAYPDDSQGNQNPNASQLSTEILIPGRENCLQCHAPPATTGGQVRGGARYDCTECHRYHHGDNALHGLGAAARRPHDSRMIDAFLSGSPKR